MQSKHSIVMLGATGAVGTQTAMALFESAQVDQLTLLGRRPLSGIPTSAAPRVQQYEIDIFDPPGYAALIANHDTAICTLGVGQPSKMSKESFIKIDKTAVLDFAIHCKLAGVKHFELLSSVGAATSSSSFFLRTKGELQDGLRALDFERLSIFQPSMILTPENRYGFVQGMTLLVWPVISPLLVGPLRKYRGIPVATLGKAMANNALTALPGSGILQ